jgi:N-acetylglucosamine-6-sulfatase
MPQTRRQFLTNASAVIAGASAAQAHAQNPSVTGASNGKPRNILFILTDDQRFDMLGCLGHPFLETPHLDELVRNGVLFENAVVTTALCSPSRASILSGLYAHSHGVLDNSTKMSDDLPTCPKLLQNAGYKTAFIGKWHMGGETDEPRPGFDHWVSFKGQGTYVDPTFNVNGERRKMSGYVTDLLTDEAVSYLKSRDTNSPFMLYLGHKAVHADFTPAERHRGCYKDKMYPRPASMADTDENYKGKPAWVRAQRSSWHGVDGMYNKTKDYDTFVRAYCETMRAVDDSVGRIVSTLRELGLLESTLLVFTSDNGFQLGDHGLIDKRTMYEPSIRVPLIVHCPELAAGGQKRKQLTANIDFAPTFLELAGVEVPASMHGQSFLPVLKDATAAGREAVLYEYLWERSFSHTPTVIGVRTQRYSFMRYHGLWSCYELYDLENDPDEMNNLLGDFVVNAEGGTLDSIIRNKAPEPVKKLFIEFQSKLFEMQRATGCLLEPSWRAI